MGRWAPGALLLIATAILAGCGSSAARTDAPADTTTSAATVATETSPTTATAPTTTTADPLPGAGTDPVSAPAGTDETALLERVAVARHEGYDRVVFQFRNVLPGYRVEYVEPPFTEDGSGTAVDVAGNAFVQVRMEPASGFDLSKPEGELVYTGPRRIDAAAAGASVVRELVRTGDFEAVLTWTIGLRQRADFRVTTLDAPPRLVIDFRNG